MLKHISLRTILLVGAVLAAAVPALLLAVGSADKVRARVVATEMQRGELIARGLASEYEQFLTLHLRAIETIAAHVAGAEPFAGPTLMPILARTRTHYPALWGIGIVDASGRMIAADTAAAPEGRGAVGIDLSDRAWFQEMLRTKRPLVDRQVGLGRMRQVPTVTLDAPVLDSAGRLKGAVTGDLDLQAVEVLAERVQRAGGSYVTVASAQGVALAHLDSPLVREGANLSGLPIWGLVTAAESGQIPSYDSVAGAQHLAGFATVPGVGWKVWVSRPLADVAAEVASAYRRVLGWVALAILGGVALVVPLALAISRPIHRLRLSAAEVAAGHLGARVPEGGPKDVAALAREFNRMAERLGISYARLEDRTRTLQALVRAGLALTSSLESDRILQEVIEYACRLVDARSAVLRLLNGQGQLEVRAAHGVSGHYLARSAIDVARSSIAGEVLRTRQGITVADLAARSDLHLPLQQILLEEGIRAMVTVPIAAGERTLGVLTVHKSTVYQFSEEEVAALTLLAEQTGIAIEHARLLAESDERSRELAAKTQELEAFTYTVSHDLKSPLRGMDGYARAVIEDYGDRLDDTGRHYLAMIQTSTRRMGQLIDDLLRYSRLERRGMRVGPVPLQPLCDGIVAELEAQIHAKGLVVEMELAVEGVRAEREGLQEALVNLVENAVKFSPGAGGTIRIGACEEEQTVTLWVADTGIGFDMRYHDRIFQIFERLNPQEAYPGTGVGLAIVRKVADRHGGRVWATSEPGKGSTFYLALPVAKEEEP